MACLSSLSGIRDNYTQLLADVIPQLSEPSEEDKLAIAIEYDKHEEDVIGIAIFVVSGSAAVAEAEIALETKCLSRIHGNSLRASRFTVW
jgi:hypothetical protein